MGSPYDENELHRSFFHRRQVERFDYDLKNLCISLGAAGEARQIEMKNDQNQGAKRT